MKASKEYKETRGRRRSILVFDCHLQDTLTLFLSHSNFWSNTKNRKRI